MQYEQNSTSKRPLVITTAVIPSYKSCLLGQVTLIHLHLSSLTEFSELGNGSQKVPCYDDWLQAGHWMLLNLAPHTLLYLLPQQLQRVHMSETGHSLSTCGCHNVMQEWQPPFSVTNNKGTWNNSLHHHLNDFSSGYSRDCQKVRNTAILWECSRHYQSSVCIFTL